MLSRFLRAVSLQGFMLLYGRFFISFLRSGRAMSSFPVPPVPLSILSIRPLSSGSYLRSLKITMSLSPAPYVLGRATRYDSMSSTGRSRDYLPRLSNPA